ncbi:MAG TPA: hypothetical protein VF600_09635 [Abditibacteriaceae bacterium]
MNIDKYSDDYEELGMAWQSLELRRLNEALKQHGVDDKAVREAICISYGFDCGVFLDQGWLKHDGRYFLPRLCFIELTAVAVAGIEDEDDNEEDEDSEVQALHLPSSDLHDSLYSNADFYFNERNEVPFDIPTGSVYVGFDEKVE